MHVNYEYPKQVTLYLSMERGDKDSIFFILIEAAEQKTMIGINRKRMTETLKK